MRYNCQVAVLGKSLRSETTYNCCTEVKMIKLWKNNVPYFKEEYNQEAPSLTPFIVEGAKSCIIVIPGGAYQFIAGDHEGLDIVRHLNENGISAFLLRYRVAPYHHPVMQCDINRAVRVCRFLASEYGYDSDKIAVLGFSAGGHLVGTAVTHFDYGVEDSDEIDKISCRPDMGILCYAVLNIGGEFTHWGTTNNLIGDSDDPALCQHMSCEKAVREDTPPCFIWHTAADQAVPCENSLMFAAALSEKKIPFELHIFPEGRHGLGHIKALEECPHTAQWLPLMIKYVKHTFGI